MTQASLAAKNATATIPIVMVAVGSPVEAGLIASLARPGANITGTSTMADASCLGKTAGAAQETLPKISRWPRFGIRNNPIFQASQVRQADSAAKALPVTLQKLEARDPAEIVRAFTAISKEGTKALDRSLRSGVHHAAEPDRRPCAQASPAGHNSAQKRLLKQACSCPMDQALPESLSSRRVLRRQDSQGAKPAGIPVDDENEIEL